LNQGVIEQPAYVALVLMALLTTIITPLALRNLFMKSALHNQSIHNSFFVTALA
jgi:hypothetical protein